MKRFLTRTMTIMMAVCILASFAACGKKSSSTTTTTTESETAATSAAPTTTAPTTSLTAYSGPDTNPAIENPSWTETEMEPTTMYVNTSDDYLNVRQGPDANYYTTIVSKLPRGSAVTVIATTSNGWYKTSDGYYVTGTYLSATPVT